MIPVPQKKKKPRYSVWRLYRGFLFEYIVEVFTKSSAHGYFQLAQKNRHPSETIMWTLAIVCAICTAIYAGMTTLVRHWMSPTVISVERDYYSWNSSFPSVTICPHDKIDEILLQQYINNSMASNKTELEIFLRNLANAKFDSFEDVPLYPGISSNDYLKILLEITSTMEHTITTADGRELTFQKTVTEMGICFTINSLISDYQSPEYILNPTNRHKGITQRPLYTVHALDGEVFAQVLEIEAGFDVFVHSPFEIAGMRKIMRCDTSYYCFLELQSLPIICTNRAKDMYISQRKCRFTDEPFPGRFNIYSYNLCRMEARAQICKRFCSCVPYFIPKLGT